MSEVLPIFPLPNHVVLPQITMPYRLFEDRYRALGHYLLEHQGDGLFIPCLKPGWEDQYQDQPPFFSTAVHCSIIGIQEASNGEFALLVNGGQRCRLEEAASNEAFRFATAQAYPVHSDISDAALQQSLLALAPDFRQQMLKQGAGVDQLKQFLDDCDDAAQLLYRMAHLLFSEPLVRQDFIDCDSISAQLGLLRTALGHRSGDDISLN